MKFDIKQKEADIQKIAGMALNDRATMAELTENLLSKDDLTRFNSFKVLLYISENQPEILYSQWDYFADMLESKNSYSQYIAVYLISRLAVADVERKFERIIDRYFGILEGTGTIAAAHAALNSGRIAKAKPHLTAEITKRLLDIDRVNRGKQKDLVKSHAIEAFDEYFDQAENKEEILAFVRGELNSTSPRTKKLAKKFLEQRDE